MTHTGAWHIAWHIEPIVTIGSLPPSLDGFSTWAADPFHTRPCYLHCAPLPDILEQLSFATELVQAPFSVLCLGEHWALQTLVVIAFKGAFWLFAKQPLTCPNLSASPSASRASMETSARLPKAAGSFWYGNSVCASLAQTWAPLLPLPLGLNRFRCSLMKEECGLTFSFFSVDRSQGEEKV